MFLFYYFTFDKEENFGIEYNFKKPSIYESKRRKEAIKGEKTKGPLPVQSHVPVPVNSTKQSHSKLHVYFRIKMKKEKRNKTRMKKRSRKRRLKKNPLMMITTR